MLSVKTRRWLLFGSCLYILILTLIISAATLTRYSFQDKILYFLIGLCNYGICRSSQFPVSIDLLTECARALRIMTKVSGAG